MRKRWFGVGEGLLAVILLVPQGGLTQPTSEEFNKLLQDIESLKAGQKAISNELPKRSKSSCRREGIIARLFVI
jgi:hypothetical protein